MNMTDRLAADLLFAAFLLPTLIVLAAAVVSLVPAEPAHAPSLAAAPAYLELAELP